MFKECCKQCRHVKFKGTITKCPEQKQTHRTAQKTRRTPRKYMYRIAMCLICTFCLDMYRIM